MCSEGTGGIIRETHYTEQSTEVVLTVKRKYLSIKHTGKTGGIIYRQTLHILQAIVVSSLSLEHEKKVTEGEGLKGLLLNV